MTARWIALALTMALAGCGAVTEPYGLKDPFGVPKPFEGQDRNAQLTSRITEIPDFLVGGIDGMEGEAEDALRQKLVTALQDKELTAANKMPSRGAWLLMGAVKERVAIQPVVAAVEAGRPSKRAGRIRGKPGPYLSLKPGTDDQITGHDIEWTVQDGQGVVRARFATPFTSDVAVLAASKLFAILETDLAATVAAKPGANVLRDQAVGPPAAAVAPHAAVASVSGAPGDGDAALSRAIGLMLQRTGLKVTDTSDAKAWRISGTVIVATEGTKDSVTLKWQVTDAKGLALGNLEQKNQVPAKSLAKTWGETAALAAAAAAPGLAEIIAKAHNAGLDPQDAAKPAADSASSPGKQ